MRGDPTIRVTSTHPFHRPGPITDDRRRAGTTEDAEQRDQPNGGAQGRQPTVPPSGPALEGLLADELADLLWRRPELGLDRTQSSTRKFNSAPKSGTWWDQLLAEIEDLAGELRSKVALYAMFPAIQGADEATGKANAAALVWIHETLEDIAATALGMEMASREAFLRTGSSAELDLIIETIPDQTGTKE